MTEQKYLIRTMTAAEIALAVDWAAAEGWNPGHQDADCFYQGDRQGFFVGLLDGEPIATISAVKYNEEFGFIGALAVLAGFIFLINKCLEVSRHADNAPGKLIVIGITSWIAFQFLIHMMANSGLIPYTGVPLPLISYGGSSLLFCMIALGIIVNVAKSHKNV